MNVKYKGDIKEEVFKEVLELLCTTDLSLREVLASNPFYPSSTNFLIWVISTPETKQLYNYSIEIKAQVMFNQLTEIANGDPTQKDSLVAIQRDKLRVDTGKFAIAKMLPNLYGDRVDINTNAQTINVINLGQGTPPPDMLIDITPPPPLIGSTKTNI